MRNTQKPWKKDYVKRSHERCFKLGIDPTRKFSNKFLTQEELKEALEKNKELLSIAEPCMNRLYDFVKGSNFFSILTDKDGCILRIIGDEAIMSNAFSLKMVPGAYMAEKNIGTNAMGTALAEGTPVQISGDEHFIQAYHQWTCSAAPIKNPMGEIIGTLDLTGYSHAVHSHTLGIVVAAARSIENTMKVNAYNNQLIMAKNYIETIIDSIPSGLLTSDLSGTIKTANKHIQKILGWDASEIKKRKIWELFDRWDDVKNTICSNKPFLDEDVYVNAKKNISQLNLSAYPIVDNTNLVQEIIFVFYEVKKVRKLANKLMGCRAIYTFDKIIGKNDRFLQTMHYAKKIADSKSTILITGESGTGKELFAQSIHNYSKRKDEPFIAINCGAIPRSLIESELFGYEEGAFTGAKRGGNLGKFQMADGGTIFLDEIGEMPIDLQANLLRVIEEGTVSRIGSAKQIPINVRIIAATNKDLKQEVEKGNFRKDLYYRLNVLPIYLPALRERRDDIPLLIEYFMETISKRLNKRFVHIPSTYMDYLIHYDWPGNIRELENLVELIINTEYLPINFENKSLTTKVSFQNNEDSHLTLDHVEHQHILKVLKKFHGNITLTAKALGIGRNTLYRKINKYHINCSTFEHRSEKEHSI